MASYLQTLGLYSKLLGVDLDSTLQEAMDEVISRSEELVETEEEKLQKQRNRYNKGNSLSFTMDGFGGLEEMEDEGELDNGDPYGEYDFVDLDALSFDDI